MSTIADLTRKLNATKLNLRKLEDKYDNLQRSCNYFKRRCEIIENLLRVTADLEVPRGPSTQESFFSSFLEYRFPPSVVSSAESFADVFFRESQRNGQVIPRARRWSSHTVMFSFVVRSFGPKSYDYMRKVICLPSKSTLVRHFTPVCDEWRECLINVNGIDRICDMFRSLHEQGEGQLIDVVLGVDAMSIEPVSSPTLGADVGSNNVFLFYMMPLNCEYRSIPVHLMTRDRGNAGDDVHQMIAGIAMHLRARNFNVKYIATDGDSGYLHFHQYTLHKWWQSYEKSGLDSLMDMEMGDEFLAVGDLLHILKNARSRLLSGPLTLHCDGENSFTAESMNEILKLGNALTDRSSHGKMRDIYPLQIYTLENVITLAEAEEWIMAFYVLPYALWVASVCTPGLSQQMRRDFLNIAFEIFAFHKKNICSLTENVSQNRTEAKIQFCCSDVQCTRILNTLLFLLREITNNYRNLALSRIGTHCLECQFGLIRGMCRNKHSWNRVLSSFSRLMVIKSITRIFGRVPVSERVNVAGVKLYADDETSNIYIPRPASEMANLYEGIHMDGICSESELDENTGQLVEKMRAELLDFIQYIRSFIHECLSRNVKVAQLWEGSAVSNNGILARLISFEGHNAQTDMNPNELTADDQETVVDDTAGLIYVSEIQT